MNAVWAKLSRAKDKVMAVLNWQEGWITGISAGLLSYVFIAIFLYRTLAFAPSFYLAIGPYLFLWYLIIINLYRTHRGLPRVGQ